jgi:hypothetical protein
MRKFIHVQEFQVLPSHLLNQVIQPSFELVAEHDVHEQL